MDLCRASLHTALQSNSSQTLSSGEHSFLFTASLSYALKGNLPKIEKYKPMQRSTEQLFRALAFSLLSNVFIITQKGKQQMKKEGRLGHLGPLVLVHGCYH